MYIYVVCTLEQLCLYWTPKETKTQGLEEESLAELEEESLAEKLNN